MCRVWQWWGASLILWRWLRVLYIVFVMAHQTSTSTPEYFSIVDCVVEHPLREKAVVMNDHVRNGEVCLVSDRT